MYEIFEKLLNERGMTAYRFSQETGITTGTLSSWKVGRYTPKKEKMQIIADYFDVPLDYLLTGVMPKSAELDETEMNLLRAFRKLNIYGKKRVMETVIDCLQLPKYTQESASHSDTG